MFKAFFTQHLYVQLSPERMLVRDPNSGQAINEVPEIALQRSPSGKLIIVAVGRDARGAAAQPDTTVHNPFAHPRSLVSDFTLAELVLKGFIWRVRGKRLLVPRPVMIVHPLGEYAGGLTQLELRAVRELALAAGAAEVRIWLGPALTDEQLLSDHLPATGRIVSP